MIFVTVAWGAPPDLLVWRSAWFTITVPWDSPTAQRVPNTMNPKRHTPRHTITEMIKVTDKERILKAARKKQLVMHNGTPIRLSADFSAETAGQKGVAQYIQSAKRKKIPTKNTLPSKVIIQN